MGLVYLKPWLLQLGILGTKRFKQNMVLIAKSLVIHRQVTDRLLQVIQLLQSCLKFFECALVSILHTEKTHRHFRQWHLQNVTYLIYYLSSVAKCLVLLKGDWYLQGAKDGQPSLSMFWKNKFVAQRRGESATVTKPCLLKSGGLTNLLLPCDLYCRSRDFLSLTLSWASVGQMSQMAYIGRKLPGGAV